MVTHAPPATYNINTIAERLNAYFPRHGQSFNVKVRQHHKGDLYCEVYKRGNGDKPVARIELWPSGPVGMEPRLQILSNLFSTEERTLREACDYACL